MPFEISNGSYIPYLPYADDSGLIHIMIFAWIVTTVLVYLSLKYVYPKYYPPKKNEKPNGFILDILISAGIAFLALFTIGGYILFIWYGYKRW